MVFFIVIFVVYTLVNGYIFGKGWRVLPARARGVYGVVYFLVYSSFVVAMLGRNFLPLEAQRAFYVTGTVWLGAMLYLTLWFLTTDGVFLLCQWGCSTEDRSQRLRFRRIQVGIGYSLVMMVLCAGYYRFNRPSVVEKVIEIRKSGGQDRSLKVVAFSDLHLGVAIDKGRLQRYVQLINDQHPDLILIGGDVVDNNVLPLNLKRMQEELNRLQASQGVFMCLGNHEYLSGIEPSLEFLQKTQIRLLVDQVVSVNDRFWIIGRDDTHGNAHRQPLASLVSQTDTTQPLILIDHEPWNPNEAVANRIDLQFSGHTHHGQLWPMNWIVDQIFPIGYGYQKTEDTHLFVSSGLGLWGPPFRLGTQSEIVVFWLQFGE
jgi:predicted MPP superfamily phosphohydrolase